MNLNPKFQVKNQDFALNIEGDNNMYNRVIYLFH